MTVFTRLGRNTRLVVSMIALVLLMAACGGDDDKGPASTSAPVATATVAAVPAPTTASGSPASSPAVVPAASPASAASPSAVVVSTGDGPVLPIDANPIANASTAQTLEIDSVLVENNEDPSTGQDAPDHLEIALNNVGAEPLTGFEVFYTFNDPTAGITESYYAALPATFSIPAGESRVIHFDDSGQPDHFPVNKFSLYATSLNELDLTVVVSAVDAAPQTASAKKDAGGAEVPD